MKKVTALAAAIAILLIGCSYINNNETENGSYQCQVSLEGGSGRASLESPAKVTVEEGRKTVELVWSSPNYDYMIVDDVKYDNEAEAGENSVFTIPFLEYDTGFDVVADTTAMSKPHEIEYKITVYSPGKEKDVDGSVAVDSSPSADRDESISLGKLKNTSSLALEYAKEYTVDYYSDEAGNAYSLITIGKDVEPQYFLLGQAKNKPDGVSDNVTYINQVDTTYLVSTSVMDLIAAIDALDSIRLSGTDKKDWDIAEARDKMKSEEILYAGKYSAPDYELLVSEKCNFAIENTMIYHNPEVKEKLESLGIPVMVERSSYENNPLGRLEWIKLYGLIYGKQDKANQIFDQQKQRVLAISDLKETNKTVAFFSIDSSGMISVRKNGDYITSMIDMAGGTYVPKDLVATEDNALSSMKITVEDFYVGAVDADVLIYNSTIEGEIDTVGELLKKAPILGDFKAVKNDKVYCLDKGYFQQSADVAEFIEDVNSILNDNLEDLKYIYKLGGAKVE
ncbi:MAG: ABC transporter substrate-binding protein [Pseudobutyrivibrio sp.]|nr:ABC transporter substrate-binding protein [Pseudobutyrivibrio sp.]